MTKGRKKMKPRDDGRHPAPLKVVIEKTGQRHYPLHNVVLVCDRQSFVVLSGPPEDAQWFARSLRLAIRRGRAWDRGER